MEVNFFGSVHASRARATNLLRNYGLFWPVPAAALMPMIEVAGDGGS